jgi:hypothetical protein
MLAVSQVKGRHRIPVIRQIQTARDGIDRQRLRSKIGIGSGHAGLTEQRNPWPSQNPLVEITG